MKAQEVKALYDKNWLYTYKEEKELFQKIKTIAENGGNYLYVLFESQEDYDKLSSILIKNNYDINEYDKKKRILNVSWLVAF